MIDYFMKPSEALVNDRARVESVKLEMRLMHNYLTGNKHPDYDYKPVSSPVTGFRIQITKKAS